MALKPSPGATIAGLLLSVLAGCRSPAPTASLAVHQLGDTATRAADGAVSVYVPAGNFTMGGTSDMTRYARQLCQAAAGDLAIATCGSAAFADEHPAHPVSLSAFWIDRSEVTNRQYARCVDSGACTPPVGTGSFSRPRYFDDPVYDDYPIVLVDWHRAAAFCAWAGARLPTEAEWEFAARGPENRLFPWGDTFDPGRLNYCDRSCAGMSDPSYDDGFPDTAPVGFSPQGASWVGALDMAGNVREWVADWYGPYSSEAVIDPKGPGSGESRIARGGSWYDTPDDVRSVNRGANLPDYTHPKVGFRCAVDELAP
jgi:formylglycine-generating enzyme required for sulfatase activity